MTVLVRLTEAQRRAAANACDLIADSLEADGRKRDAALYRRTIAALEQHARPRKKPTTRAYNARRGAQGS